MKKIIVTALCAIVLAGCSAMQKKADGRYFDIASNNNSEASIFLEKIVIDGDWSSGATGIKGCGGSNINGGGGVASPSYNTPAPNKAIYLEWYAWGENSRMKADIKLPGEIINEILLNPPWANNSKGEVHKSVFIIDFRNSNKVWIKLAKNINPKSQDEVMILAEGQGRRVNESTDRYEGYKQGKSYTLNCGSKRERYKKIGAYTAPLIVYDKWYPGAKQDKEEREE